MIDKRTEKTEVAAAWNAGFLAGAAEAISSFHSGHTAEDFTEWQYQLSRWVSGQPGYEFRPVPLRVRGCPQMKESISADAIASAAMIFAKRPDVDGLIDLFLKPENSVGGAA